MKCVEILSGDNKGTVVRVSDEEASVMVGSERARYVPKSRYKDIQKGAGRIDKAGS